MCQYVGGPLLACHRHLPIGVDPHSSQNPRHRVGHHVVSHIEIVQFATNSMITERVHCVSTSGACVALSWGLSLG